jgi:drug/metabolite transporter (DMT)-like permease
VLKDPLTGYPISTYLNFFGLGVLVQAIGWLAINYAQGFLPASLVSPTLLIQPLLTAILAGPLLGETFSAVEMLGGVAVLGGIVIVYRSRQVTKVVGETI